MPPKHSSVYLGAKILSGFAALVLLAVWNGNADGRRPEENTQAPNASQTSGISQTDDNIAIKDQYENYAFRWYKNQSREKAKGVALVIHGLNLRPDKMQTIISVLAGSGIDVLRLSLRGHGENYTHHADIDEEKARLEAFKAVSFPLWLNEAYLAYTQARERAAQKKVPLFFVGFSLGGLIGLDLFASQPEVHYDRMILFAPAVKLHSLHYLGRILSPMSRLVIPSMAPDSYLSNKKGTPVAAYNALFEGLKHFEKHVSRRLNVPTLIFIDEDDEFIPAQAFEKLKNDKKLDQWRLYIVKKGAAANRDAFHHHIIDESSTGKAVWQKMMETTIAYLFANRPNE
ncbi:MAG: alpha/beta fold hydrolase [Desulfobacteraceae bacterium]|jgi:dienelactone hydrolase|nr:alpha/beta fold hydrolase [Desulfobacteraceae bacterium]